MTSHLPLQAPTAGSLPRQTESPAKQKAPPASLDPLPQGQRSCMSLSAVDRLVTRWFVTFCLVNSFLMVVFAGGTFGQLDSWLKGQACEAGWVLHC